MTTQNVTRRRFLKFSTAAGEVTYVDSVVGVSDIC